MTFYPRFILGIFATTLLTATSGCDSLSAWNNKRLLQDASARGNSKKVIEIASNPKVDVNLTEDPQGLTPLMLLLKAHGDESAVLAILNNPTNDINRRDSSGVTAIFWALAKIQQDFSHRADYIRAMLKNEKIDLNLASPENWLNEPGYSTPLKLAVGESFEVLVKDPRVDINFQTPDGDTVLLHAARFCQYDKIETLLQNPKLKLEYRDPKGRGLKDHLDRGRLSSSIFAFDPKRVDKILKSAAKLSKK